jgi:acyl carrier protein
MSDVLLTLFAEVLGVQPESLNDNSSPDNTRQWDSLAAMHLVAAIEDRFKVRLGTKDILRMSSIGKAREALREKNVQV